MQESYQRSGNQCFKEDCCSQESKSNGIYWISSNYLHNQSCIVCKVMVRGNNPGRLEN